MGCQIRLARRHSSHTERRLLGKIIPIRTNQLFYYAIWLHKSTSWNNRSGTCGIIPIRIEGLRADDLEYHQDLLPNVLTYIYGCNFGIAAFERIESERHNPNVALEVGYMIALGKPVCLLKNKNLSTLETNLEGKFYRNFDPFDATNPIGSELSVRIRGKRIINTEK